jgi:hypothetical protein
MRVMWVTQAPYDASPVVQLGSAPGSYNTSTPGSTTTYTVPLRWWGGFNGFIHNVRTAGIIIALRRVTCTSPCS